jgi:O-antigen biosynthesis protein WbqP
MIRFFDILLSLLGCVFLCPIMVILFVVGLFDTGSPLFLQKRVGLNRKPFILIKFRTMHKNTASVATHIVQKAAITKFGSFLRKSKLDELPQLFNVLFGHMSLVGPRPNLENQIELIQERINRNVYCVRPGITGLAQIMEVDMSTPEKLANIDANMIKNLNLIKYFEYIFLTITGKGFGDRVK